MRKIINAYRTREPGSRSGGGICIYVGKNNNKEKWSVERVYFIIMANVFNTSRQIHARYDLKGSKAGRQLRKNATDVIEPSIALKDLDFDNDKNIDKTCSATATAFAVAVINNEILFFLI